MPATTQAGGGQQAIGLPRHRLAGVEQHCACRHASGGQCPPPPGMMRYSRGPTSAPAAASERCHKASSRRPTAGRLRPSSSIVSASPGQAWATIQDVVGMVADQALEAVTGRVRVVAQHADDAGFRQCAAGRRPVERHFRQLRGAAGSPRPPPPSPYCRQSPAPWHPAWPVPRRQHALPGAHLGLVAIRQEAGIGKIEKIFLRQAFAQGTQDRQTAKTRIENGNRLAGGHSGWFPEKRRNHDRPQPCASIPAIRRSITSARVPLLLGADDHTRPVRRSADG